MPRRLVALRRHLRRVVRRLIHGRMQREIDRMAVQVDLPVTNRSGGRYDAFSHAYGSARLTLRLGGRLAHWLGELNEMLGSDAEGRDTEAEMDRYNNTVGRAIGRRQREQGETAKSVTARLVKEALDAGELRLIRERPED